MSASEAIVADRPAADPAHRGHLVGVRGARKTYGSVEALKGVDLDIREGSFTVLLGPSGSGKTTLLRAIAGIERLDAGSIRLGGRLVSDSGVHVPSEKRDLAMVFQDYALWPHMTVRQNVAYPLRRRHARSREASRRVDETLERVGLGSKASNYPHELSGGQQQRVALARAIVGSPSLILFDEPLSNLDADLREHLRLEIATLTRESGATALYITHDQGEAFALADEVAVLRAGTIEQRGTPESIYRRPETPFVARFTGLAGSFTGTAGITAAGYVSVRVGDHELKSTMGPGVREGSRVDLMIRPIATRLEPVPNGSESAGSMPAQAVPGRILDVAYRGRGYDHVVECEQGVLTSVFDERAWTRGDRCLVRIDPEGCLAFPSSSVTHRD
ncbi:ABC transporter ATP-binding protein [Diaminobutyricibacter tongyongensis]|uniref:ABC-type quaternary amine transporter n=1 Tax=Leifsonia tongyongensis TaxID=1268043 RepID=A0A6L9XT91_9MICO|nr:ABC transporter ATP-binding protein [Diaminobutyricibacter tongyongensis]NEN04294.1 ABC transporter ATP-binding protein [Diaminobutyricibacter tongyongensis]